MQVGKREAPAEMPNTWQGGGRGGAEMKENKRNKRKKELE